MTDWYVLVMSGKGGVGKSSFVRGIAHCLRDRASAIRVLDVDLTGPSMERLLGVSGDVLEVMTRNGSEMWRAKGTSAMSVMSISALLKSDSDAVIWRGPKKCAFIDRLLGSVVWPDELDPPPAVPGVVLTIIDTPPGTSDEHMAVIDAVRGRHEDCQLAAVLVTTDSILSISDVRRQVSFCEKTRVPVLGIVQNMAGSNGDDDDDQDQNCSTCPSCRSKFPLFPAADPAHNATTLAEKCNVPFCGKVPFNADAQNSADQMDPSAFAKVADFVWNSLQQGGYRI